jgi:hypothetical protein
MEKQEIVDLLKDGACVITFEKADGSTRVMLGTLHDAYINVISAGSAIPRPELINVWDIEKDAWRSFRVDRMKDIHVASDEEVKAILVDVE